MTMDIMDRMKKLSIKLIKRGYSVLLVVKDPTTNVGEDTFVFMAEALDEEVIPNPERTLKILLKQLASVAKDKGFDLKYTVAKKEIDG